MMSLRTVARCASRAVCRSGLVSLRQPARALIAHSPRTAWPAAPFSTTGLRRLAAVDNELDGELSAKLESEIQIEEGIKTNEQQPASIRDFLDNSPFELIDVAGQEVVKLTRPFGDEKITVSFSIADITNFDPYSDDAALDDEDLDDDSKQRQDSASASSRDEDVEDMDEEEPAAPITLSIVVEKPGKTAGALSIDATAQDGAIVVDNVLYHEDAGVARIDSPEAAQKRADVYPGPPFGSLDDDLQVLMERFLEERGINQALAVFVPDFIDVKEQREYLRWLRNVKGFIDA